VGTDGDGYRWSAWSDARHEIVNVIQIHQA
jgi:hypothetical protein